MDGIAYLKDYCEKNGIKANEVFQLGRGTNGPTKEGRYVLNASTSARKDSQLFAIQYCKDVKVYIAWDLKRERRGSKLTQSKEKVQSYLQGHVLPIPKYVGHVGNDYPRELTPLFTKEEIPAFLETYIMKTDSCV